MKKTALLSLLLIFSFCLFGQNKQETDIDQWLYQTEEENIDASRDTVITNDLIKVNYNQKSAHLAMAMSMLIPGTGQFYANRTAITTYIFPILELGFIGGIVYYNKQGNDKTDKYEKYANGELVTYLTPDGTPISGYRYERGRQNQIQDILKDINTVDIYEDTYFRLDENNSQHFYEDSGKYPHYVFGWMDWYYRFAADESGNFVTPRWQFDGPNDSPHTHWTGNYPICGQNTDIAISINSHEMSRMRQTYIKMRNDAKDDYGIAHLFTFGLAFNHLVSGLDAVRVTRNFNRYYISQAAPSFNFYAAMPSGNVTPMVGFKWMF